MRLKIIAEIIYLILIVGLCFFSIFRNDFEFGTILVETIKLVCLGVSTVILVHKEKNNE